MVGYGSKQLWSTLLTANDSTAKEELGSLRFASDGKMYRYVQTIATVAAGDALRFYSSNRYRVTATASAAGVRKGAGFAIGAITASYFGWIQCGGFSTCVRTTSAVAAGDNLILAAATDSAVITATSALIWGGAIIIGTAEKADSGHICSAAFLRSMI